MLSLILNNRYCRRINNSVHCKKNTIVLSFIALAYLSSFPTDPTHLIDRFSSFSPVYLSDCMHACGVYSWDIFSCFERVISVLFFLKRVKTYLSHTVISEVDLFATFIYIRQRKHPNHVFFFTVFTILFLFGVTLQVQQGTGGPPTSGLQGVGVPVNQQGMFMAQGVAGGRATGFPVGGMGSSALQGPLAYLEKTTSNIGMPERRS